MEAAAATRDLYDRTITFEKRLRDLTRGQFFSVTIEKLPEKDKTKGEERKMVARLGVRPKKPKLDPVAAATRRANLHTKGMIVVWDSTVRDYRIITLGRMVEMRYAGHTLIGRNDG